MNRFCVAALLLMSCFVMPAAAVIETYEFSNEELEQRYQHLSAELRCPKCQNQNIADSNAPIAQDLRKRLYQQLEGGASDSEILDYMVARYGEFVLYRPRFSGATAVLWLAPGLLLVAAIGLALLVLRRRKDTGGPAESELSAAEQQRLHTLLDESESGS